MPITTSPGGYAHAQLPSETNSQNRLSRHGQQTVAMDSAGDKTPWEFQLSITEIKALLGQLIDRCEVVFSNQPLRKQGFAVGITLEAVEVFGISRNPEDGKISVQRSGPQLLSISHHSPELQWISRILQTSLTDLGLTAPCL